MSSRILLLGYDDFMFMRQVLFVSLILCLGEIFYRHHNEDIVIQRSALQGDHPGPNTFSDQDFPSFGWATQWRFQNLY